MGRGSKRKGYRGEREFADLVGGQRVPLSGAAEGFENDVILDGIRFEVKRRKDGFKTLYGWLKNADALAIRADYKEWLVVLPVGLFLKIFRGEGNGTEAE